ncbi:DNA-directed RNA polymerase II subunit rpb1, partial [Gonapodya sp. JEL0774]
MLIKGIRQRLKGKEGRLRGNLMGKRVDFSARTVITGDPNISIDEVGVPRSIARTLTFPDVVCDYNRDELQRAVRNGLEWPGANRVIRVNGDAISMKESSGAAANLVLQNGDRVERHIRDGDWIIFNRQPSLHKMSMMGHRVRVMPYSTFRLNLSVTSPYNADFDGDEMNLHAPQSHETRAEIKNIMAVPRQIVSPKDNKPVMGIVQDTLCGIRKFTVRDNFLTKDLVMNILMWVDDWDGVVPPPAILKPVPLWTGKQLLSMIIPDINLIGFAATHPDDEKGDMSVGDTKVLIEGGELIAGTACKKTVGSSAGGVVHTIMNEHGPEAAKKFFDGCQRIVNYWLLQNGFSVGIGDTIADKATMQSITNTIKDAKAAVAGFIERAHANRLDPEPGMTIRETFESHVNKVLNTARDQSGKMAERSLKIHNNVKQMVIAGSKGSFINISQMTACVGQQNVEGKRIPYGFRNRTLPHFTKDDHSPESRGFVENSYLRGLTPQEFFFHAMGGREGLIDTAVKTAETGYIQRRLVKALEDVMVKYDGTVRDSLGQIIQFCYGEDGMDATGVERQQIETIKMNDAEFFRRYRLDLSTAEGRKWLPNYVTDEVRRHLLGDGLEANSSALEGELKALLEDRHDLRTFIFRSGDSNWPLPSNIRRLIWNARNMARISHTTRCEMTPVEIIEEVNTLLRKCVVITGEDGLSKVAQTNATRLFGIHIRHLLAVKRIYSEHRLTRRAFDWLIGEIESRFKAARVNPAEMVGTIAAQSIGEPATQMTLNTFHYAGVGSKNVTLGVPRLKEIMNVATNTKTPSLLISLKPNKDGSPIDIIQAKKVSAKIEYTTLGKLATTAEIYYDPDLRNSVVEADRDWLDAYFDIEDAE